MVWVILACIAIVFAVLVLWAATQRGTALSGGERRRPDLVRSASALVAAAIASVAAVDAYADQTIEFPPIVGILGIAAVAAVALAFLPLDGGWSANRRLAAAIVACIWFAVGVGVWPFAIAASACACTGVGPYYVPPAPLGIDARGWITMAILAGPLLLALVGSRLPDRLFRAAA